MAILKCKMCGGDLEVTPGITVAECEYCGTKQTLPKVNDEVVQNLFNRANNLRIKCEFDKAEQIYEKIVQEDNTEAEAHWGIVLCKYGIEYVEDPKTYKRIPTCHRTSYDAVTADADYLAAIQYADAIQRSIYEAEAKAIDEIQKNILTIVKEEKPFDVFLCYKETDEDGKRTMDSAIANDIYHQLTQEGLKVFYAAITLEDKLGQAYEPYIFAALNSAKVMLAIGTKPQYFTAVWVKNEWSRFLRLMKTDRSKLLIPCYKDMDAYDLPEEFAHLQAQDMGKIGFINDVVRGIKKVTIKDEPQPTVVKETVVTGGNTNTAPLLKRAFMFLEDGEWDRADEFCEQVLNMDPECAQAYLGKLMAELQVKKQEKLQDYAQPFDGKNNYQKALRFADDALKATLTGYIDHINTRNENARKDSIYQDAVAKMGSNSIDGCKRAINLFASIPGWKDADGKAKVCQEKIERLKAQEEAERLEREQQAEIARQEAVKKRRRQTLIIGFLIAAGCILIAIGVLLDTVIVPNGNYNHAVALMEDGKYTEAIAAFQDLDGYKDSDEKIEECKYNYAVALMEEGKYTEAIAAFQALNGYYKDSDEKIEECNTAILDKKYNDAVALKEDGKYIDAKVAFEALNDYKDAKAQSLALWDKITVRETVSAGGCHTVGLKDDGTVVAVGDNENGRCDVSDWKDIVAISAGYSHTVGLKADCTVVAVGDNYDGQCDVSGWTDIVTISAGYFHTVGLKADGTVVAVGYDYFGRCNVRDWKDIVAISAGTYHTVGLKADGTVVAAGNNYYGECDVSDWTDIVAVSAGDIHTVGLKADGTVVAVGDNDYGKCDVSGWKDIVAISASINHTVGLKADGTVVAVGSNSFGQCDVSGWTDIIAISAGLHHTIGLKADGTVVAVGNNDDGQCNVSDWTNIKVNK